MITRRQFLKVGLAGGVALAGLGAYYAARQEKGVPGRLNAGERAIVAAIVPPILAGVLPGAGDERQAAMVKTIDGVAVAIAGLSASAQQEIAELFSLLGVAPVRMLLAGVWSPWESAGAADVAAFLERWRMSRLALLRSAYAALHDLVLGAWYGEAGSWAAIGYPGPPEVLS
jgi:hypothetical protein